MPTNQPRLTRTSEQFIREIIEDANRGRCFIPFLGSGLSSASGIIMGLEFTNYLAFASYLVLADPKQRPRTHGEGKAAAWDIQRQGWPPLPSQREVEQATAWIKHEYQVICGRYRLEPNYEEGFGPGHGKIKSLTPIDDNNQEELIAALVYPPIPQILRSSQATESTERYLGLTKLLAKSLAADNGQERQIEDLYLDRGLSYEERIREKGIRALTDWKSTLTFLSMVRIADDQGPAQQLRLDSPSAPVIDAFNQFMTRDKKPNLGHKVIAHLSGPLRFFTLLTTNFDKLTEDAYRMLRLNLVVFPVVTSSGLPDERTIASSDALIKLHGESHDTRADLSLDEEPSSQDKAIFAAYMTRGRGHLQTRRSGQVRPEHTTSNRLLVIGYSGSDHRCVQMIKHWLETATDDPRVYWICFSDSDVDKVKRMFSSEKFSGRVRIVQTARPDLLLYELYQRLTFSLPPGGTTYEFSHLLPPNREAILDNSENRVNETFATLELELANSPNPCASHSKEILRDIAVKRIEKYILDAVHLHLPYNYELPYIDRPFIRIAKWHPIYRNTGSANVKQSRDFHPACVIDGCAGVVRAASLASQQLASREFRKVFWMEMEDYMDGDAMLREFLRTLALRHGQFQSRHVTMHPFEDGLPREYEEESFANAMAKLVSHFRSVMTQYRVDPTSVVVMIYGRDSYGTCSGIWHSPWITNEENAHDTPDKKPPDKKRFFQLHFLIEAFSQAGIPTVYFPLTKERADRKHQAGLKIVNQYVSEADLEASKVDFRFNQENCWVHDPYNCLGTDQPTGSCVEFEKMAVECSVSEKIIRNALKKFFKRNPSFSSFKPDSSNGPEFIFDVNQVNRNRRRQLEYLYALSLFRHARHANAACSEAVYPCPYRYNMLALDNDFIRSIETRDWLKDLRAKRLFLNKPGGEFWMHRDTRIIIRQILEKVSIRGVFEKKKTIFVIGSRRSFAGATSRPMGLFGRDGKRSLKPPTDRLFLNNAGKSTARGHERMLEARARIHFWIADWYQKAFLSSGHLSPVLHSLHHCVMAASYAQHSKIKRHFPEELQKRATSVRDLFVHRTMLFESAVAQASKTLILAWRWIELWQASPCKPAWMEASNRHDCFAFLRESLDRHLGVEKKPAQLGGQLDWDASLKNLKSEIDTLEKTIFAIGAATTMAGVTSGKGSCSDIAPESIMHWMRADAPEPDHKSQGLPSDATEKNSPLSISHDLEMIGLDTNSFYKKIEDLFARAEISGAHPEFALAIWTQIREISKEAKYPISHDQFGLAKANWKLFCGRQPRVLHDMVWLLGEVAYLMLKRAKLELHAHGRISQQCWTASTVACNLGIDMCKHLPPSLLAFELVSKIKMHSIYSVGLANLGRFFEANRHLNEAQALLSKSPGAVDADHGIVALRRAEVKLTECFWIQQFLDHAGNKMELVSQQTVAEWQGLHDKVILKSSNRNGQVSHFILPNLFGNAIDCWHANEFSIATMESPLKEFGNYSFVPPNIAECFRINRPPGLRHPDSPPVDHKRDDFEELTRLWFDNSRKSLVKLFASILDESVVLLEKAEVQLGGSSQHALWWSRLRLLQLRVYGMLPILGDAADTCIVFRKQCADIGIYNSFAKLVQIAGDDQFLLLRALRYFLEANEWYTHQFGVSGRRGVDQTEPVPIPSDSVKRTDSQSSLRRLCRSFLPDSFRIADEVYDRLKATADARAKQNDNDLFCVALERLRKDFCKILD